MLETKELRWRQVDGTGVERARVVPDEIGVRLTGEVLGPVPVMYTIRCDEQWRTREVRVSAAGRSVHLMADGIGNWTHADRTPIRSLHSAIDVDISATPISNTLPVRRLALADGAVADIVTAYVAVPELTLTPDPQRYTRLTGTKYRYESRDSDFTRDITIDADGFVIEYPGLFVREAP